MPGVAYPATMFPVSTIVAGFIAVLVGYTGSAAIIFQAATTAGASEAVIASWMGALGLAMGVTTIGLSLRYRMPILTAWSTPGAAVLVVALSGVALSDAIGAFIFCGILTVLTGVTGVFERIMDKVPVSLASALLAGVLAKFGMEVFVQMESDFTFVFILFVVYLIAKSYMPRYAMVVVFITVVVLAFVFRGADFSNVAWEITQPVFIMPTFNWNALIGVGLPLFIVTMASQNAPGVAVMQSAGYTVPISPIISWTGVLSFLLAPFGCFAINMAAITAAICASENSHPDSGKRYFATISAGIFYLVSGVFAASIVALFAAFPVSLVLTLAGLALFSTIGNSLNQALVNSDMREPALITFLITLSGVTLFGIGSAFWGLVGGGVAAALVRYSGRGRALIKK